MSSLALAAVSCASTTPPSVTAGNNQGPSATSSNSPSDASKESSPKSTERSSSKPSKKSSSVSAEDLLAAGLFVAEDMKKDCTWTVSAKGQSPQKPKADAPAACPFLTAFYDGAEWMASSAEYRKTDNKIQSFAVVYGSESDAKAAMEIRRRDQKEECQLKGIEASFTSQGNEVTSITSEAVEGPGYADEEVFTELNFKLTQKGLPLRGGTLYAVSRVGRTVVITNYKNTAGDVGKLPRFAKQPMDRLRDAGA